MPQIQIKLSQLFDRTGVKESERAREREIVKERDRAREWESAKERDSRINWVWEWFKESVRYEESYVISRKRQVVRSIKIRISSCRKWCVISLVQAKFHYLIVRFEMRIVEKYVFYSITSSSPVSFFFIPVFCCFAGMIWLLFFLTFCLRTHVQFCWKLNTNRT